MIDYYSILGIEKDATQKEIKAAFKRLAQQYHPDRPGGGDSEKFNLVVEAYDVLSDNEKRERFDSGKPVEKPDVNKRAEIVIYQWFSMIIDEGATFKNIINRAFDILANSRNETLGKIRQIHQKIESEQRNIKKFESYADRIKSKSEENLFENIRIQKINDAQYRIEKLLEQVDTYKNETIPVLDLIEEILNLYEDTKDFSPTNDSDSRIGLGWLFNPNAD